MSYNSSAATGATVRHIGQALEALNTMIIPPKSHNRICGVYAIVNTVNGHRYIGGTIDIRRRFSEHKKHLSENRHHNIYLQRAWTKYGEACFRFDLLLVCDAGMVSRYEQILLDGLHPEYNIAKDTIAPMRGRQLSAEAIKKISIRSKGHKYNLGRKMSEETRRKQSIAKIGNHHTLGYRHSDEAKRKIGEASRGNQYGAGRRHSEECKQYLSEINKGNQHGLGYRHTEDALRKISEAGKGRQFSEETRRKISEAAKKREERKRANG